MSSDNSIVDQIIQRISIYDVVSEVITLKKKGQSYLGLCPFHGEKTPSFYVTPSKGVYHCFGCKASGNIFTFYKEYHNMDFKDALEALANKANIVLPKYKKNPNWEKVKQEKEVMLEIYDKFAQHYHKNLFTSEGKPALEYLYNRGFSKEIIKKFQLGYSLFNNNYIFDVLQDMNISNELIVKSGMKNEEGRFFFTNRIMFPIKNIQGKVVAFGGRAMNDYPPKYLNSRENMLFHKKQILYGGFESLKSKDPLIIVEGYLDVLALHQKGYSNTVATLGTAFSEDHLLEVYRRSFSPIFFMDSDLAGKKASVAIADMVLKNLHKDYSPKFLYDYSAKDPDELLKKQENISEELKKAQNLSLFLWSLATSGKNLEIPEDKISVKYFLDDKIKNIPNMNIKNIFSRYFYQKINYTPYENNKKPTSIVVNINNEQVVDLSEKIVIAAVICYPELLEELEEELSLLYFKNENNKNTLDILLEYTDKLIEKSISIEDLFKKNNIDNHNNYNNLLKNYNIDTYLNALKTCEYIIEKFKKSSSNQREKKLLQKIKILEESLKKENIDDANKAKQQNDLKKLYAQLIQLKKYG